MNEYINLPKPDKRYKPGKIVKNKKGEWRGHPETVIPKRAEILQNAHFDNISLRLNPPLVVGSELGSWIKERNTL